MSCAFFRAITRFIILAIWIAAVRSSFADTLVFENGDRLTGTFLRQEDGLVYFVAEILGPMEIDATLVEVVLDTPSDPATPPPEVVAPPPAAGEELPLTDLEPEPEPVEEPTAPPEAITVTEQTVAPEVAEAAVEKTEADVVRAEEDEVDTIIAFLNRTPGFLREFARKWSVRFDIALTLQDSERDRNDFDLRLRLNRKIGKHDIRFDTRYNFAEVNTGSDINIVEDRILGSARYRYDFTKRTFLQSLTNYKDDTVKRVDLELEESIGVGWRFLDRGRFQASITPAMTVRYQDLAPRNANSTDPAATTEPRASLYQDFRFRITERLSFNEESTVSFGLLQNDDGDYELSYEAKAEFRAEITQYIDANLTYEIEFDNSLADDVQNTTTKFSVGIGLKF